MSKQANKAVHAHNLARLDFWEAQYLSGTYRMRKTAKKAAKRASRRLSKALCKED